MLIVLGFLASFVVYNMTKEGYKIFFSKKIKEQILSEETPSGIDRLEAVNKVLRELKVSYPDAKSLDLSITFDFATADYADEVALVPVVKIKMNR